MEVIHFNQRQLAARWDTSLSANASTLRALSFRTMHRRLVL